MNQLVSTESKSNDIHSFHSASGWELAQRMAKALSASTLVPKHYQNNLPNCLIALEIAQRLGASPLLVMQHLYLVHGNPGWSAQFLIATFNQCGRFSAIKYRFTGEQGKDSWGCIAYAKEKATGEVIESAEVTISLAKKEGWHGKTGSKWQTMPQQMLMYRSAAWLVRTHAPELSMGIRTADELNDIGGDLVTVTQASRDPSVLGALEQELLGMESAAVDPLQDIHDCLTGAATEDELNDAFDRIRDVPGVTPEQNASLTDLYNARIAELTA
jgi:hypothetical protein